MKMRLICLTLSILMLLTCFLTGCSSSASKTEEGESTSTVDNSAKTITMWVVTSDETTPHGEKLVNDAFTKITKSKFKTNVEIKFCTADEYYEKLEAAIGANEMEVKLEREASSALRAYQKRNEKSGKSKTELILDFLADETYEKYWKYIDPPKTGNKDEETVATEEETVLNEYQIPEIKYPASKENQVDIFYIGDLGDVKGETKYNEYFEKEWLTMLNEQLAGSSSKLTKYISPTLLNGVKIDGGVYGIPNNVPVGEYTYMMIDYDMLSMYRRSVSDTDTVADSKISNFLKDIASYNESKGLTADDEGYIVPLESTLEECLNMLVWYWDLSYIDRSVYYTYYDEESDRNYALMQDAEFVYQVPSSENPEEMIDSYKHICHYWVVDNMVYKVDGDGNYVDADGNVLKYTYILDESTGFVMGADEYKDPKKEGQAGKIRKDPSGRNSWYLVDENGDTVRPENDKRVIVADAAALAKLDKDGKPILKDAGNKYDGKYAYEYEGHPVEIAEDDLSIKYDSEGNVLPSYIYAHAADSSFSVVGTVQKDPATRSRGKINLGFNNLFTDESFVDIYTTLMDYSYCGLYGTPDADKGQTAAVSFVSGDARILMASQQKEKVVKNGVEVNKPAGVYVDPETGRWYRVVVAENPMATSKELYGNMFAVYAQSNYLDRSMEVITYLNTHKDMRDLLQYGIKDMHYTYEEAAGVVRLLEGKSEVGLTDPKEIAMATGIYRMDVERTGNCFIVTPTQEQGADVWEYAKMQNTNSLIDPLLGFDFNAVMEDRSDVVMDPLLIRHLNILNTTAKESIAECTNVDELRRLITNADTGLVSILNAKKDELLLKALTPDYDPAKPFGEEDATPDKYGDSPNTVYFAWLNQYGYQAVLTPDN